MVKKITLKEIFKMIGYYVKKSWKDYQGKTQTYETKPRGNYYISTGNMNSLINYIDDINTEVIAYNINPLGLIVMFKGKIKVFCYGVLRQEFSTGGHNYKVSRLNYSKFFTILKPKNTIILNKELYNQVKCKVIEEKI